MLTKHDGTISSSVPSNINLSTPAMIARCIVNICCAITDNTSNSILLNSSKHDQAPAAASPLKNLPIAKKSSPSEQLNTITYFAIPLPKSLTNSVLPVPAGPWGAPPMS